MVNLSESIAPSFYGLHRDIKNHGHTHYVLKGGRGSTKSSFISLEILLGMMKNPQAHALVLRQTAITLHDSVYSQLLWGIETLGASEYWERRKSPLRLIYKPTGQQIIFRGADDPLKIKSVKPPFGYFAYVWFEEFHEFEGMDAVRTINQSVLRGGDLFWVFYSYNPPKSINNWVNAEVLEQRPGRVVHHSHYKDVNPAWLGEQFIAEAEDLLRRKPEAYRHEYDGEITGTGGAIFDNVVLRRTEENEIKRLDYFYHGLDWGFTLNPAAFVRVAYDKDRRRVVFLDEIYGKGITNSRLADMIIAKGYGNEYIQADSEDPKSVYDMYDYGLNITGVKKWPGSVKNGIEFFQDLDEIVIDPARTPNTAREFSGYEYELDRQGNFILKYPDKDNHTIDAGRYALVEFILARKERRRK